MIRAVRVHQYGGPEVLALDELPMPQLGPGQLLVEVKAAGVNFFDTQLRSGLYRFAPLPISLGNEGAGIVRGIGPDVEGFSEGDRVGWMLSAGSYATHALVNAARTVKLPEGLSERDAAAGLFQGATAHYLAHSAYAVRPGDICLVHSAAGGVGLLLCQMATMRGARVIGTTSNHAKAEVARQAGAADVIVTATQDIREECRRITGGRGVDVVYDAVGRDTFEASLASLKRRGSLVLYGEASGLVPPMDVRSLLFQGSVHLTRTGLDHYLATQEEFEWRANDVLNWIADGRLRLHVSHALPLAEVSQAHQLLEGRSSVGKVILLAG